MNNKLFGIFMFAAGAAIGSAVTWKIVKTKYEQIVQEEIDSVKEEYVNLTRSMKKRLGEISKYEGPNDADEAERAGKSERSDDNYSLNDTTEKELIEYSTIARKYRSSNNDDDDDDGNVREGGDRDVDEDEDECEAPYINGPYVISPEQFACSPPGYNAQPLDYFADGILADTWGVRLDIDETIGEDSLNHFGEYQDDILYVRNDRNEVDYEVTRDPRTYEEVVRINPNPYYGR